MKLACLTVLLFTGFFTMAQQPANLVIITLDGMRWQEVFGGVDSALMNSKDYTHNSETLHQQFWSDDIVERRKKLFPFLWTEVATSGQIYGNRWQGNRVDVANPYNFSYPGYNEIFTGYPDAAVNSNDKIWNKNINVLEYINRQKDYKGKVAAFSTWDVFPYILNEPRSGIYVNADADTLEFNTAELKLLNDMQFLSAQPIGVRLDVITYMAAREYLKAFSPRVLYIAFDETDDYAHNGMYDQYIKSAHATDGMIADLWQTMQAIPQYKNNTTLLITCDHGRGDIDKTTWTSHGQKLKESSQIWIAALGNKILPKGEITSNMQLHQKQLAPTIAALLGYNFRPNDGEAKPIESLWK